MAYPPGLILSDKAENMNCEKVIAGILGMLDVDYESPAQMNELVNKCSTMLSQLAEECSETLLQFGQDLLERSNESEDMKYKFQLILKSLAQRHQPGALELNIAALLSRNIRDKEAYIDLIETFKSSRAIPALIHAIKTDNSVGEDEGLVRYKAIEALCSVGTKEVASIIIPYVKDSVYRVRGAAINFLRKFDISEAAPVIAEWLSQEENPTNLEYCIAALVHWKQTGSLPELREILTSGWIYNDKDLQRSVSEGILALEAINKGL
ncbi:HEAT repeat domain-containing protein [Hymenobacter sp. BT664]|uniref:HEAT repeat domain-containing protein n=1 Tax=Hymenobacter montanus TaxID=2771359 RepID=A0A927BDN1_9BACT|nr:HEAT repeat domain-containing protein [Hymenobacter montanus]MBD2768907.1 HEAT repeat domain-containing protein [Hymenobacter montanus]